MLGEMLIHETHRGWCEILAMTRKPNAYHDESKFLKVIAGRDSSDTIFRASTLESSLKEHINKSYEIDSVDRTKNASIYLIVKAMTWS